MDALARAIEFFGSQSALASALSVTPMTVTHWKRRGVPPERCPGIETATDQKVTRFELRPDVFGHPPAANDAPGPRQPSTRRKSAGSNLGNGG